MISMLPGKWSIVEKYDSDILLKNEGHEEGYEETKFG